MDFALTAGDLEFRDEVRAFLRDNLPPEMAKLGAMGFQPDREASLGWQKILSQRPGWSVPMWPKEHGGPGWTVMQRYLFEEECFAAGAPTCNLQGTELVGPVIYSFGNDEQKQRFLPGIRNGKDYWCQGFSEPNAGSDLANLRTKAIRDGDHYVVNGQKIWTSQAQWADWLFLLVRTDPEAQAQRGISFLLVDMKTPGITVRPIVSIDGSTHLTETFYDDVRVPVTNLVGEENKGWGYTKFLLGNERAFSGASIPTIKRYLQRIKRVATAQELDGKPLLQDAGFAYRLAQLEVEVLALEMSVLRVIHEDSGTSTGGWAIGSVLKVRGTELQQRCCDLLAEALGTYAAAFYPDPYEHRGQNIALPGPDYAPGVMAELMYRRAASIFGGSAEIQHNIIAKMILGM